MCPAYWGAATLSRPSEARQTYATNPYFVLSTRENAMTVRLTLICHASTNAVREVAFPADEPIDPQGQAKAAQLAGALRRVDATWTSPALRARQTAAALRLEAMVDPALKDVDLGRWVGRSFADIQEAEPEEIAAWTGRSDAAPHGGESVLALLERISGWLEAIKGQDGRIVAVTHPAVIRAAVVLAIDAKPISFWRIDIAPLCRVSIQGNISNWTLRSIIP
jgi:broad specificity phosphatase PhoE